MTFPQFNRKHLEEALFNPGDYVDYKKLDSRSFPKKMVVTYQSAPLRYFKRKYAGKYKILRFAGNHDVLKYGQVGLIRMTGIGSPHAITIFEELIAMGAKEFINIGTAGGLNEEGVFIADKAIRDEGTSHHYIAHGKYAYPDKELTKKLERTLQRKGIEYRIAPTWTIDAPYRETRKEIEQYRKEGVATVEMEASALFAVAKVRKVKIASAFVVSDILGKKWEPTFHHINEKRAWNQLDDSAIETLRGKT